MLDNILIIVNFVFIIVSFVIARKWRKNHFVKEVYISEGTALVFYVVINFSTVCFLIGYFTSVKGLSYSWLYLLNVLLFDLVLLFLFCIIYTTCIYLKDDVLVQKSIVNCKQITLNTDIKIIERIDKKIIRSNGRSIAIRLRYFDGNINNLMNTVKTIINR